MVAVDSSQPIEASASAPAITTAATESRADAGVEAAHKEGRTQEEERSPAAAPSRTVPSPIFKATTTVSTTIATAAAAREVEQQKADEPHNKKNTSTTTSDEKQRQYNDDDGAKKNEKEPDSEVEEEEEDHDDNGVNDEWTSLMGQDLVMKTIRDSAATDDAVAAARIVVQPQDVVRIEIVGRLCPTKEDAAAVTALTSATDDMQQQQEQERYPPIFIQASNWVIQIGAKDVVPAIEMGARFMKVGQTALVWSHSKYAYGYGTRRHRQKNDIKNGDGSNGDGNESSCYYYELPPNSNVCFEITVHQVYTDEEESNDATFLARSRKAIANDVYAHEWQDSFSGGQGKQRAIYLYQKVAKDLLQVVQEEDENSDKSTTTTRRDEALTLLLDCLNNIVAVYLRAHEYHAAKLAAVRVLEVDPNNLKALLRAAQASLLDPASSYEEVQASLQAATERLQQSILVNNSDNNSDSSDIEKHHQTTTVPPADLKKHQADLRRLKADFAKRQYEYKQKSKAMFSKALLGEGGRCHATMTTAATTDNVTTTTSPKDKPPLATTTTDAMDDDQDDAVAADFDAGWYKKLPWRAQILPLLLQMILPFVMWYFVHCYRRPPSIHDAKTSLENDTRTGRSSSHSSSTRGTSNDAF